MDWMYGDNLTINDIEVQYQRRKSMTPVQIVMSWKNRSYLQVLFSEYCFYNLKHYKEKNGEDLIPDHFWGVMEHLFYVGEWIDHRLDFGFYSVYSISRKTWQLSMEVSEEVALLDRDLEFKLRRYGAFFSRQKSRLYLIDRLTADDAVKMQPLAKLLKKRMKTKFVRADEFQDIITKALKRLAFAYAGQLKRCFLEELYALDQNIQDGYKIQDGKNFVNLSHDTRYFLDTEKDKILNPSLLAAFKKDKIAYLETLGAWFSDALELHKDYTTVEKLPDEVYHPAFVFRDDIANTLAQVKNAKKPLVDSPQVAHKASLIEVASKEQSVVEETTDTINIKEKNLGVLRVFNSEQSFEFFDFMARKATSKKQMSYIYRRMSEKQPIHILLKDTEFRKWYSEHTPPYPVLLDCHSETLDKSTSEDRVFAFELAYALFFKETKAE